LIRRGKKNKEKKIIKKKKNVEIGRSLPLSSRFALSLLASASTLMFLPFCFKCFLLSFFFFSSIRKEKKKMQRKEGTYLSSLTFAFGMKHSSFSSPHSFNLELSTFLKPCVSCLLEVLCYSSSEALPSFGDGMSGK
jgi:hypothetical protein